MQIVVPMSGASQRFVSAGIDTPKALIVVNNKTILQHIVEMYPGASRFIFVCRDEHLTDSRWRLQEVVESLGVPHTIIPIRPHKLGPAHAVMAAEPFLLDSEPVIVNYSDFACRWDFSLFLRDVQGRGLSACMPAYRGFHPHSGGETNYAYISETDGKVLSVQEKQPFTGNKIQEFTSTGAYYFSSAELMYKYIKKLLKSDLMVNGEFYLSGLFELMAKDGVSCGVFEIEHFMQWGTPQDLAEYTHWSNLFLSIVGLDPGDLRISGTDTTLYLASGLGSRFTSAGYSLPKQALPLSGLSVLAQALKSSDPNTAAVTTLKGGPLSQLASEAGAEVIELPALLTGQASSAQAGIEAIAPRISGNITVLPTDTLFANNRKNSIPTPESEFSQSLVVWVTSPNAISMTRPSEFGWVWRTHQPNVFGHSLKSAPDLSGGPSPEDCLVLTGAFTFSSTDVFRSLMEELVARDIRVAGELYLDSLVSIAPDLGIDVQIFQPTFVACLGTPLEYESFLYWQACFDNWQSHPYSLEQDPFFDDSLARQSWRGLMSRKRKEGSEWSLED